MPNENEVQDVLTQGDEGWGAGVAKVASESGEFAKSFAVTAYEGLVKMPFDAGYGVGKIAGDLVTGDPAYEGAASEAAASLEHGWDAVKGTAQVLYDKGLAQSVDDGVSQAASWGGQAVEALKARPGQTLGAAAGAILGPAAAEGALARAGAGAAARAGGIAKTGGRMRTSLRPNPPPAPPLTSCGSCRPGEALRRMRSYPGSAVIGVVDVKSGKITYENSRPRNWEGPAPEGFRPVNGGHAEMYERLRGVTPTRDIGKGGDVVAFTVRDDATVSFKSASVNELVHNNIDLPSYLQEEALPIIKTEFGLP